MTPHERVERPLLTLAQPREQCHLIGRHREPQVVDPVPARWEIYSAPREWTDSLSCNAVAGHADDTA